MLCRRVINSNAETALYNFTGVLSGGSSQGFDSNSSDFANVYDGPDDYDTWRMSLSTDGWAGASFVYAYTNSTTSRAADGVCLVVVFDWSVSSGAPPGFDCGAKILAQVST